MENKETQDLSAPASPVEESARLEDRAEYAKWITDTIKHEMALPGGNYRSLALRLSFELQAHIDAACEGGAEWESKYKDAQNKLDKLTESKPSPVIEIGEQKHFWTDALVKEYAEVYRFSSSRTSINQFKEMKGVSLVPSHPAPAPIVGERRREEEEKPEKCLCPNWAGEHAGCNFPECERYAKKKLIPVNPPPTEQDLHEQMHQWIEAKANERTEEFKKMLGIDETASYAYFYGGRQLAQDTYHKMHADISALRNEIATANALIKEKQEWINSHI